MKKVLAVVVALVLVLSLTTVAMAEPKEQETGAGTIAFREGDTPEIIDPPPELNDWGIAADLNLDFGLQTVSGADRSYSSVEHARTPEGRLAGVVVRNESTQANWILQVSMTGFTIGETPTMAGFELELIPESHNTNRPGTPQTVNTVKLTGNNNAHTIMTITPVSTIGANWRGVLDVLGGSVQHTGEASATMTWTVVNGA